MQETSLLIEILKYIQNYGTSLEKILKTKQSALHKIAELFKTENEIQREPKNSSEPGMENNSKKLKSPRNR